MKFRKILLFLLLPALVLNCRPRSNKIQRIIEDGVEVVLNPIDPYKIKGEPSDLTLQKLFIMDFERDDFAEIGIPDIGGFDVDSEGNIHIWTHESAEYFIFKFGEDGKYMSSFGRRGQGPGELDLPVLLRINDRDEILVAEMRKRKLIVLDTDGNFIKEIPIIRPIYFPATLLENEKILATKYIPLNEDGMAERPIIIWSADFEAIAVLHAGEKWPNWRRAKRINGLKTVQPRFPPWYISKGLIYIGNQDNGYEILVYDYNGILQKKIRKKYSPAPVPDSVKERVLKIFDQPRLKEINIKDKVYFPAHMPPFQYFFVDEQGRLFVMTYKEAEGEKKYKHDIFNPDGVFIGRTSLDNFEGARGAPLEVKVKNDCLYYLRGKDSGYQELVVCKMIWAE